MKIRLLSTNLKSSSLKRLAQELSNSLGYKVWRSNKKLAGKLHLLYGDQRDKLFQYKWFKEKGILHPAWTTSHQEASSWIKDEEATVLARTLTKASEGKGIVICESVDELVPAPVYTKYIPKKREYRVHIFKDRVVRVLEKRKKHGTQGETKIRNTANGYVFCRDNVVEPDGLRTLALLASKVTNSDFKGVDIGYNVKKNQLFVIEVNSAPGIEGSNVQDYVNTIKEYLQNA